MTHFKIIVHLIRILLHNQKQSSKNCFTFNQTNNLTINIYSNLSNIIIHFYLKHRIPIMQRQFFRIFSQNPEYVGTHCNDKDNPFFLQFSIRRLNIKLILYYFFEIIATE